MDKQEYFARIAWLRRYGDAVRKQNALAQRLAEARTAAVRITPALRSVRVQTKSGASESERAVERMEEARARVQAAERIRKALYAEIFPAIAALPDANGRQVLCRRYIRGQSVRELAEEMHISISTAKRMHKNAIEHLDTNPIIC